MILNCAECKEDFVARYWQRVRANKGKTVFVCSLSCRGSYGKKVANEKYGLKPLTNKQLAREKVRGALRQGNLKRPDACEKCDKVNTKIYAHHYAGYDRAYHIQWLCSTCHTAVDLHTKVRGNAHPIAKLTDDTVRKIKCELSNGGTLGGLAKLFGVSKKTIVNIKHDRIWRHVI